MVGPMTVYVFMRVLRRNSRHPGTFSKGGSFPGSKPQAKSQGASSLMIVPIIGVSHANAPASLMLNTYVW